MLKVDIPSHLQTGDWVRMPKPKERFLGLTRTTLLELSKEGAIKSVLIRKRDAVRGIRLVYLPSLLNHLENLLKEQSLEGKQGTINEDSA